MATIAYFVGGTQVNSKNVWKIQDDGSTLTIAASYLVGGVNTDVLAMAQDFDGNIYIAGGSWVYKYDSDMNLDTTWGDSGIFKGAVNEVISCLAVDLNGYLAVGCYDSVGVDRLYLVDDDGTEVWAAFNGTNPGDGFETCHSCKFDAAGNVVSAHSRNSGQSTGGKYKRSDGTNLQFYWIYGSDSHPALCWVFSNNSVVLGWGPLVGNGTYVRKSTSADSETWSVTVNADTKPVTNAITVDDDNNVYIGCNATGTKTIYKLTAATGATAASYDTGHQVKAFDIDSNGNLIVGDSSAAQDEDGDTQILRVFDTDLTKLRGLSTASITAINAIVARASVEIAPQLSTADKQNTRQLVSISNNEVWYESTAGTMAELTAANGDIDCSKPLTVATAFQKVFIANGTNLKVADFVNSKITTADVGANPPDFGTVLTGGTSDATMIVDYITTLTGACVIYGKRTSTATFVDTETVTGTDDDGNAISFVLNADEVANPHWYDWTVFGNDSSFGVMPAQAYSVWQWRGRVCLSNNTHEPNQWYFSKQFNPFNFVYDYDNEGAQTAVAGRDGDVGEAGDIVRIGIPYNKDYCALACATSFWYFAGDPAEGGSLDELKGAGGILGKHAWCWDDNGNLYACTTAGLIRITPGFETYENLNQETYPDFITDLAYDESLYRLTMGYDSDNKGIIISRVTLADATTTLWWYDFRTQGLFPWSTNNNCGIFSMFSYESGDADYRKLVLGCNDGFLRYLDSSSKSDDAGISGDVAIDSYVTLGPIKLSDRSDGVGKLGNVSCVLAGGGSGSSQSDSDDVAVSIWTGDTGEQVIEKLVANSTPQVGKTFSGPGRIRGQYITKFVRGNYAGIRIGNSTIDESWAMEKITGVVKRTGRQK
jgi:hypothetical protein